MAEVLTAAYEQFLKDIREGKTFGNYLDQSDLEDDYTGNEIRQAMGIFADQLKRYLRENFPAKYIVYQDWCVHVMTIDEAERRHMRIYRAYLA